MQESVELLARNSHLQVEMGSGLQKSAKGLPLHVTSAASGLVGAAKPVRS
jgi:hypothetical protein